MHVWTERNKAFVSCSDFVGYGNSLSNILTFLLSYTELIKLTALELAIGFLGLACASGKLSKRVLFSEWIELLKSLRVTLHVSESAKM